MATIQINLQSTDAAKRDLTNTRQAIADINKQIAENTHVRLHRSDEAGQQQAPHTEPRTSPPNAAYYAPCERAPPSNSPGLRDGATCLTSQPQGDDEQAARQQERINRQEQAAAGRLFAARQNFLTNLSFILGTVNRQL